MSSSSPDARARWHITDQDIRGGINFVQRRKEERMTQLGWQKDEDDVKEEKVEEEEEKEEKETEGEEQEEFR